MNKRLILNFVFLSAILLAIMLLAPQTLSLLKGGFEDVAILDQFKYYIITGVGFLVGITFIFLTLIYLNYKSPGKYGYNLGYSTPGEIPGISFFKRFSQFQLFLLSLIVFSTMGLFTFVTRQQVFTGVGVLPQQFTAVDSMVFSSFLIPVSENLGACFVVALGILILIFICNKYNLSRENFIGFSYFIPLVVGLFGVAWHSSVYKGSDVSSIIVFIFWMVGGLLSLVSGSFIPFWMMHFSNNLFFDLGRFFSNESLMIYVGTLLVILAVIYVLLYKNKLFGSKTYEI